MKNALAALAIIAILTIGCGKHAGPSLVERTDASGNVSVEIPTEQTYPRDELPAGVAPKDVAAVITLTGETESEMAPGPGDPVGNATSVLNSLPIGKDKVRKPIKQDNQLFVMKDGSVIAGKSAAGKIVSAEKVERSWKWLWWLIGILSALISTAWAVDKFVKPISLITRVFRR